MKEVIETGKKITMIDPFTQSYVNGVIQIIDDVDKGNYSKLLVYANSFRRKNMLACLLDIGSKTLSSEDDRKSIASFIKEVNSKHVANDQTRSLFSKKIGYDKISLPTLIDSLADSKAHEWVDSLLGSSQDLLEMSLTDICVNIATNLKSSDVSPDLKKAYSTRLILEVLTLVQLYDSNSNSSDITKLSSTAALHQRVETITRLSELRVNDDVAKGNITCEEAKVPDLIKDRTIYHLINTSMADCEDITSSHPQSFYKDAFSNDYVIDFIIELIGSLI